MEKHSMETWLEVSRLLLQSLAPKKAGVEIFGHGIEPEVFASLIDNEAAKVDHVLVAMAVAKDEREVKIIFKQLDKDTTIALFSRWAHYTSMWQSSPSSGHWIPSEEKDIWRAVFLSMNLDHHYSKDVVQQRWGEFFSELH